MTIRRTVLCLAASLLLAAPAWAGSEALVVVHDADGQGIARAERLQALLLGERRFDAVRIATDLHPDEVPQAVADFLSKPAAEGDRRLVWVSAAAEADVCPAGGLPKAAPAAATVMLAPGCLAGMLPNDGARRFDTTATGADPERGAAPFRVAPRPGIVAFVALPDDHFSHAAEADALVAEAIAAARDGVVSPAYLLEVLRLGFRQDGSAYTPFLLAAPAEAAFASNLIGGDAAGPRAGAPRIGWRVPPGLAQGRAARIGLDLYGAPDLAQAPVATLHGDYPVTVIRADSSGGMLFVRTLGGHYGWVRRHDLASRG